MRRLVSVGLNLALLAVIAATVYGAIPVWKALLGFVAWYLLRAPAAVYASPGMALAMADYEVLPDTAVTNPESDEWGSQVAAQLAPHGFVARPRFRVRGGKQLFDFARRLDNPTTGEVATIFAGWHPTPEEGAALPARVVVFHTRFRDGELATTNSPLPPISPPLPGHRAYRIPEITDPGKLYATHRRLVKQDGRRPVPFALGDDPLAWERRQHERSIANQVSRGLAVRDERAGHLRPTLKGALRLTWLLHPWLTGLQHRRATKDVAAALGAQPA
jgi:hypothetical protein